ncbi:LamG-like jellyroll fold domain-containing protein [Longimonas sp.]|uniref:LamG-like jellyroll fold domain-containing protein n=1 Tax=Longimonas sp. TaxID=2039626 RepID=UPI003976E99B
MPKKRNQGEVLWLPIRLGLGVAGVIIALGWICLQPATAHQADPDTRWTRDTTHVVASLSLPPDTRQLAIDGPSDTAIDTVEVLHYGVRPVAFEAATRSEAWTLHFDTPQHGPFEVVMRVRTGEATDRATWQLTPFTGPDTVQASPVRTTLTVEPAPSGRDTWAWSFPNEAPSASPFSERERPANERAFTPQRVPRAFTIAFWMRTMSRNAVITSTWTGTPETPYPLELVTTPAGHLHVYHGTEAAHHPVRTRTLVADGRWHHVAVTYERASSQTSVYVDGERVAHERHTPRPAGRAPLTFGQRPFERTPSVETLYPFRGQLAWVQTIRDVLNEEAVHRLRTTATPHAQAVTYGPWPNPEAPDAAPRRTDHAVQVVLPLSAPTSTPVSDWQAQVQSEAVELSWTAPHSEGRYVVERSTTRTDWEPFATALQADGTRLSENERRYTVTDADPRADVLFYRVRYVTDNAPDRLSSVLKVGRGALSDRESPPALIGNFPNPFREETTIAFELPRATEVTLTVWTITGTLVQEVAERTFSAGYHEVAFQPHDLPSGTYFVRLEAGNHVEAHRMVMLR